MIDDLADEVTNMSAVITSLRTLALADASLPKERRDTVDLSGIVDEAAELLSAGRIARRVGHGACRTWRDCARRRRAPQAGPAESG